MVKKKDVKHYEGVRKLEGTHTTWSWRLRYEGKDYTKSGYKSAKEAYDARCKVLYDLKELGFSESLCDKTFSDVYAEFLKAKAPHRAYSTIVKYESLFKHHIEEKLGSKKIKDIKRPELEDFFLWYNYRQVNKKNGRMVEYSNEFVDGIRKLVQNVFTYAVGCEYIKKDPMKLIPHEFYKNIGKPKEEGLYIHPDIIAIINHDFKDSYRYPAFMLGYHAGLRLSEVGGLMWTDIDFDKREIHIERQMIRAQGQWCFAKLKTNAANRIISMNDELYYYLLMLKRQQENNRHKYGEAYITDNNLYLLKEDKSIVKIHNFVPLVNVKANGEKLTADNGKTLVADIRKKLLSSYPHIENIDLWLTMSFHDFRHTHATNCADDLMPAELLKQRLGHEKIETTYKYYRHRTEKSKQTEMGIINNITTRDYDEVNERLSTEAYFRAEHAVDDRYSSQNHPQTSEEVLGGKFNSQGYYSTSA